LVLKTTKLVQSQTAEFDIVLLMKASSYITNSILPHDLNDAPQNLESSLHHCSANFPW